MEHLPDLVVEGEENMCIGPEIYPYKFHNTNAVVHGKEGFFLARGPDFKENKGINPSIYDVAPTLLHLLGEKIPERMDGRVLKEIFKEGSEPAEREVEFKKEEGSSDLGNIEI